MYDRRSVLLGLAGVSASALIPRTAFGAGKKSALATRRGVMIGGLMGLDPNTRKMIHALTLVNLDAPDQRRQIPLDFFAHGFALDPNNPKRALIFEKRGPGAAEVELSTAKFMRPIKTTPDRAFYGHGVFSHDGSVVFVAESILATHKGVVSIRDARTLQPMGEFPTWGENPHDILLTNGGKTLVVTNGGGMFPDGDAPCVTFIDVNSRQLLEKYTFTDPHINAGHVALSKSGEMVVVSAPRDGLPKNGHGAVSLAKKGGKLVTMTEPAEVTQGMVGETLSISIHEPSHRAVVTSPEGNQISVWDLKTQKFVKAWAKPKARGVMQTLDGKYFVACHGQTATVSFFSTRTLEEVPAMQLEKTLIAGSHLYVWDGNFA